MNLSVTWYESPIKAFVENVNAQLDGEVLKAVQRVGIDVDRDELIKALQYDRDQYYRGFHAGAQVYEDTMVFCENCRFFERGKDGFGNCTVHFAMANEKDYCSWGRRAIHDE